MYLSPWSRNHQPHKYNQKSHNQGYPNLEKNMVWTGLDRIGLYRMFISKILTRKNIIVVGIVAKKFVIWDVGLDRSESDQTEPHVWTTLAITQVKTL